MPNDTADMSSSNNSTSRERRMNSSAISVNKSLPKAKWSFTVSGPYTKVKKLDSGMVKLALFVRGHSLVRWEYPVGTWLRLVLLGVVEFNLWVFTLIGTGLGLFLAQSQLFPLSLFLTLRLDNAGELKKRSDEHRHANMHESGGHKLAESWVSMSSNNQYCVTARPVQNMAMIGLPAEVAGQQNACPHVAYQRRIATNPMAHQHDVESQRQPRPMPQIDMQFGQFPAYSDRPQVSQAAFLAPTPLPGTSVIPGYVPPGSNSHWQGQNHTHIGPPMFQNEYIPGAEYSSVTQLQAHRWNGPNTSYF